jgi:hypothetical protein
LFGTAALLLRGEVRCLIHPVVILIGGYDLYSVRKSDLGMRSSDQNVCDFAKREKFVGFVHPTHF